MLRPAPAPGPDPTVVEGTMLQRAARHARARGLDVADLLSRVGLTEAEIHTPGALFSEPEAGALTQASKENFLPALKFRTPGSGKTATSLPPSLSPNAPQTTVSPEIDTE